MTRRGFLDEAFFAAAMVSLTAAGAFAAEPAPVRPRRRYGAADKVRLAVIGTRSRGKDHIDGYLKLPDVEIVALCDVDSNIGAERAAYIEEKTGKRPNTAGLQPGVTMEGGKVAITLNGLSQADLGKTTLGDVTSEVASRTTKWVGRALGLLGTISATSDTLSFEKDVLDTLIDGFTSGGWKAPAAATIPDAPVAGAAPAAATPRS